MWQLDPRWGDCFLFPGHPPGKREIRNRCGSAGLAFPLFKCRWTRLANLLRLSSWDSLAPRHARRGTATWPLQRSPPQTLRGPLPRRGKPVFSLPHRFVDKPCRHASGTRRPAADKRPGQIIGLCIALSVNRGQAFFLAYRNHSRGRSNRKGRAAPGLPRFPALELSICLVSVRTSFLLSITIGNTGLSPTALPLFGSAFIWVLYFWLSEP